MEELLLFACTVKLPITDPPGTESFFLLETGSVKSVTWSLDPKDCKRFPVEAGFRFAQVPFKAGFAVLWKLKIMFCICKNFSMWYSHLFSYFRGY